MHCPEFVNCSASQRNRRHVRENRNHTLQGVWPRKVRLSFPCLRTGRVSGDDASDVRALEPSLGEKGCAPGSQALEGGPCGSGRTVETRSEDQKIDVSQQDLSLSTQDKQGNLLLRSRYDHEETGWVSLWPLGFVYA